jgi:hypothetical protein
LNAPRFRPSVLSLLNQQLFDKFIKKYPEYKNITSEQFKDIINTFNRNIYKTAAELRDGIELPESLGFFFIGSCQPPKKKKTNVNYGLSIKNNSMVLNRNLNSDSFLCKIFYTNCTTKYRFMHREVWQFKASKEFAKHVSQTYKTDWRKYIQVENNIKISYMYKTNKIVERTQKTIAETVIPDNYNEFELD